MVNGKYKFYEYVIRNEFKDKAPDLNMPNIYLYYYSVLFDLSTKLIAKR